MNATDKWNAAVDALADAVVAHKRTTTDKRAQAQIIADNDGDPFVVIVEHSDRIVVLDHAAAPERPIQSRNVWHWTIESTTDAADWQPVRGWEGFDLTSAVDLDDPDPIAALQSLGSFLGAYAEAWTYGRDGSENRALFPVDLPPELAQSIADEITVAHPESCDHNDGGPCPTCDVCDQSQCEDDAEWDGEAGCHVECLQRLALAEKATKATCNHGDGETLCLSCGAAWCSTCDPGPAALCHYCHGRGYSTAEITRPLAVGRNPRVSS